MVTSFLTELTPWDSVLHPEPGRRGKPGPLPAHPEAISSPTGQDGEGFRFNQTSDHGIEVSLQLLVV